MVDAVEVEVAAVVVVVDVEVDAVAGESFPLSILLHSYFMLMILKFIGVVV